VVDVVLTDVLLVDVLLVDVLLTEVLLEDEETDPGPVLLGQQLETHKFTGAQ